MKISLNWIRDYVNIPKEIELSRLAYDLTMSTVEVEETINLGEKFDNIVVGIVKEIQPHPNSNKLWLCTTDVGTDERLIVCGGINLRVGMKTVVACGGAMVKFHGEGELIKIEKIKIRGVESDGMICTSSEIGLQELFPSKEEAEIMDLSDFDVKAGDKIADVLGIADEFILEIDNKSLTNRPDLWGHFGIAREIATIYDLPLKSFTPYIPQIKKSLPIKISDSKKCTRYIGVQIEGLSAEFSPLEVQTRLWRVGIRPINAIVDITNYVMLATGQPMHAFDFNHIKEEINIRLAKNGEKLLLLDGKELMLSGDELVIADNKSSIALAGVMGGAKASVLPKTTEVILEIANFDSNIIRQTVLKYDIRTESAIRYEKGIDPERCDLALSLAMEMFAQIFPKMNVVSYTDNYPEKLEQKKIEVSLEWMRKRLGKSIPNEYIISKMTKLGFDVVFKKDILQVIVPSWRSTGDVSIPADIIEEIARIYGFENFEPAPITITFNEAINQKEVDIDRKVREYLAVRCGMQEIYGYPWVKEKYVNALSLNKSDILYLSAPPSPDEKCLRSSLLPNLCKTVSENLRFLNEFEIFESSQILLNKDFVTLDDKREKLPSQRRNVAGAFVSEQENFSNLFKKAKGVLEMLARYTHIEPLMFEKNEKPVWADNVVWLNIVYNQKIIGNLALLSKKAAIDCGIKNSAVMLFELDIDSLKPYSSRTNEFKHLAEYPMTDYDISLLFDDSTKWEDITKVIRRGEVNELINNVTFIEEYKGNQVPIGKKSITLRLQIGSMEKTLKTTEIENCAQEIINKLEKGLSAQLRS